MPRIVNREISPAPHAGHLSGFQPDVPVAVQRHDWHRSSFAWSFFGDCICADTGILALPSLH